MVYMALIARITRARMLGVLSEDYIRTARAKGVGTSSVLLRHALKNAAVPIVTVIGIGLAALISGVVLTETVFNIPGLGRLTVDAILKRDYPIIQGLIILFAGTKVLVNLLIDISRSEEHTSELQSLMRISYAVFCLKKHKTTLNVSHTHTSEQPK